MSAVSKQRGRGQVYDLQNNLFIKEWTGNVWMMDASDMRGADERIGYPSSESDENRFFVISVFCVCILAWSRIIYGGRNS